MRLACCRAEGLQFIIVRFSMLSEVQVKVFLRSLFGTLCEIEL